MLLTTYMHCRLESLFYIINFIIDDVIFIVVIVSEPPKGIFLHFEVFCNIDFKKLCS